MYFNSTRLHIPILLRIVYKYRSLFRSNFRSPISKNEQHGIDHITFPTTVGPDDGIKTLNTRKQTKHNLKKYILYYLSKRPQNSFFGVAFEETVNDMRYNQSIFAGMDLIRFYRGRNVNTFDSGALFIWKLHFGRLFFRIRRVMSFARWCRHFMCYYRLSCVNWRVLNYFFIASF